MTNINNFQELIQTIQNTHQVLSERSVKAVNTGLTVRNWLIGYYIVEFEQKGEDRAKYGTALITNIAKKIKIKGLTAPELSRCRQFYKVYPEILGSLTQKIMTGISSSKIGELSDNQIVGLPTQELQQNLQNVEFNENNKILTSISFTHFVELIKIDDPAKRKYYEMLILKTQPNVKEIKRQIATLSYERLGLSKDKEKAFSQITKKITPAQPEDAVKSHYLFEFLGINSPDLIEETELENALINNLQQFIVELGNGFCFEARQKRVLIGDEYFFIDIVFYHRILKCHVLVELKVDSFDHSHASQLVTYLNYYKKNMMEDGDNPPIGILLVTDKNTALVEYATANEKDHLFVSKYKLNLPSEEELKSFLEKELKQGI
ncbi:MAG TPA: PDDEXK nuclease domain-containing protein [bacterium]|nr:PDDEXK nuclease domain-containing protein [bacterium]HPS29045.1 PDDEXK nuclease domain-containing protein [bacterium]